MPTTLVVLGLLVAFAGIALIFAGAPDWAYGLALGSTMIESGTIAFVGGFILCGIGLILQALKGLAMRLDALQMATAQRQFEFEEDEASIVPPEVPIPLSHPLRPLARRERPAEPAAHPSSARKPVDEEPEALRRAWPPATRSKASAAASTVVTARSRIDELDLPELEPLEPALGDKTQPAQRPSPAPAARGEQVADQPAPDARAPDTGISGRAAAPAAATPATEPAAKPRAEKQSETAPVGAVVRSGIIGGMAYSLYADGSIEAELPIGTMRFGSIEELRAHVARSGAEADAEFSGAARSTRTS
jgi:hypothetical protein